MGHRGSRSAPPPPPPRVARVERSLAAVIGPALEAALRRVHDDAVAAAADAPPHPRANELAQLRAQLLAYDWHRSTRSLTGDTFLRSARVRAQQVSVRFARTPLVQVVGARGAGKTAFIDTLLRALFAQRFTPVVPGVHTLHVRTYMGGEVRSCVHVRRGVYVCVRVRADRELRS